MRLYRYGDPSSPRVAVSVGDGRIDLLEALGELEGGSSSDHLLRAFSSMESLIAAGPSAWADAERVASSSAQLERAVVPEEARILAPLRPSSLRDFLAFEDHMKRGAQRRGGDVPSYWYDAPVYYKGNHRSIIGPEETCPWPSYAGRLDLELELAMIVGRAGRDVSRERAVEHVFGFTIFNDFSARDVQAKELSAWLGPAKAKDFANALGPCIVTADEVGAEPDLAMVCRVNGEEWGRARSSEVYWSWADIVAHVSRDEVIEPCDVYGSGTPGGCCGLDLGKELQTGDVVELEIESIGVLRNRVGERREG